MRKQIILSTIVGLILIMMVAACAQSAPATETQIVEVPVTVEVTREVIVTREVFVDSGMADEVTDSAESDSSTDAAANLDPTPIPTPFPTATPTEYGERGDFTEEDLALLYEVWDIVESQYYGNLPTDKALREAIIEAVIDELGDRFADYYPEDVVDFIDSRMTGDFEGIGAYVDTNDDGFFYIVRPIPGTPAEAAGIEPDDIVLKVDGRDVFGMTQDEIVAIVRGPAGEAVILTIYREGVEEPFDVTIVRARVEIPVVIAEMRNDNIAYVQLSSFNQLSRMQLEDAINALIDQGAQYLILDLRYNGGGLLSSAIEVGDLFLPKSDLVIIRDSAGNEEVLRLPNTGDIAEEIPIVLLVNEASASASELLAAAFRDYERATIIGTVTFGKGSVQTIYTLSDGSEMKVTTARFYSPNDIVINEVGVTPDIIIDGTPVELGGEDDVQLQRAIEYIETGQ
ncbi:MAG: S41 family peptidase [Anaerolineae bacterium]|nr:S41 family peptidase [Anaerolineae bacterium]